jgi:26S proteasome regulatory subunit N5
MEKREKSEFILEQIRLCLDSNDNIRAIILSDKISSKLLNDLSFQDIKLRYHKLLIRYHTRKENFLAICRAYLEIFNTPVIQENPEDRDKYLKATALFCALSPYTNEQSDLAHRIQDFKQIGELPAFKKLLQSFTTVELITWPQFEETYRNEIDRMSIFEGEHTSEPLSCSSDDLMLSSSGQTSICTLVWEGLRKRVIEHNIRVVAQHYARIQFARFCQLLQLDEDETEKHISSLVSSKTIFARIDRVQRIVSFQKSKHASEQLNEWSDDIGQLLQSLERVSHLIHRENMVHKIK